MTNTGTRRIGAGNTRIPVIPPSYGNVFGIPTESVLRRLSGRRAHLFLCNPSPSS